MHQTISKADFSEVFVHDSVTKRGLHRPEGWLKVMAVKPGELRELSDGDGLLSSDTLFQNMFADMRFGAGEPFPYDLLLSDPEADPLEFDYSGAMGGAA